MEIHDILAGAGVLLGLVGIVVVFLPGLLLQVAAVVFWSLEESSPLAWVILVVVVAIALAAMILKYQRPGRRLRAAGIPGWRLFLAVVAAGIGLFVIPVVGAPLFFVATIYLFERARGGHAQAWPSTKTAMVAVISSIGIELAGGLLIVAVFATGVLLT